MTIEFGIPNLGGSLFYVAISHGSPCVDQASSGVTEFVDGRKAKLLLNHLGLLDITFSFIPLFSYTI